MTLNFKKVLRVIAAAVVLLLFLLVEPTGLAAESDPQLISGAAPMANSVGTLTASVYDIEPSAAGANKLADLAMEGQTADIGVWIHSDTRFLSISLGGLPQNKQYELVIEMQPIIKAMSLPDVTGTSCTFTVNKMPVNKNGTFTAENYSGTIVYALNQGTEAVQFAVELGYDITLWSKRAGELNNDPSKPLLSVYLREKDSVVQENPLSFHRAQAPKDWDETIYNSVAQSSSSVNLFKTDIGKLSLARMINDSYSHGYYYPKLEYIIEIPRYTHSDGQTYYLNVDYSQLSITPTGSAVDYNVVYDPEKQILTITLWDYYIATSNSHFSNLRFSVPEKAKEDLANADICSFKGTIKMIQYRSREATEGLILKIRDYEKASFTYNYAMQRDVNLINKASDHSAPVNSVERVQRLGGYQLRNSGQGDSGALTIRYDFDTQNTNRIRVTTVNLMRDFDKTLSAMTVHYTMVDENGTLVVQDGVYEIANSKDTSLTNGTCNRLSRSMLPEDQQQYYFKSVEYTISTVPANAYMYASQSSSAPASAGNFWGYTVGASGQQASTTVTISGYADGDQDKSNFKEIRTIKTTLTSSKNSAFKLIAGKVNGRTTLQEITAGDTVQIGANIEVANYPYSNTSSLSGMRVGLLLPQGITFSAEDVEAKTSGGKTVAVQRVEAPTANNPLWIVYFDPDTTVGYYTEKLGAISAGNTLTFTIVLHTDSAMTERTLQLRNILFAAGEKQSNAASGAWQSYKTVDIYDLNGSGTTSDYVGILGEKEAAAITIKATPARLDIFTTIRDSEETTGDNAAALKHFADHAIYDFQISCNDGGIAKDFFYLIPVVKVDAPGDPETDNEFTPVHLVNAALRGGDFQPQITYTSGTKFKLLYSTAPFGEGRGYEYFADNPDVEWKTADDLTAANEWNQVTVIKVVTEENNADIVTGTLSVISVPLYYGEDNYQYVEDAERTFIENAGMAIEFKSRGSYVYQKGNQRFSGTLSSSGNRLRLEYTVPEMQHITLTAAKGRLPTGGSVSASVTITQGFRLPQNYGIRLVVPTNVNLVQREKDFANSNTDFAVTAQLRRAETTAQFLSTSASVSNPIPLGNVELETDKQLTGPTEFIFTIFNGDALSDTVTSRTIRVDIIGDNGVTIPVEITILLEAAPVGEVKKAKIDEKRYLPFVGKENVVVSHGSALTAQFVSADLIPNNYSSRILSFDKRPLPGTTVLMVDCTSEKHPVFYHYTVTTESTAQIPLTEFVGLADGNPYVNPIGETVIPKETLLFVVDFVDYDGAEELSQEITLTTKAAASAGSVADIRESLEYEVMGKRSFELSVRKPDSLSLSVALKQNFLVRFQDIAPCQENGNGYIADSRYTSRKMALVISAKSGEFPVDARLVVSKGGETSVHYLNAQGQFVLPLGELSAVGQKSGELTMHLLSETMAQAVELKADLYVSATANDSQPMQGELAATVTVQIELNTRPSFKVAGMDNGRRLSLSQQMQATLCYDTLELIDCNVYLEIQKKFGTGYVTDFYLAYVNGSMVNASAIDITASVQAETPLSMQFQNLDVGTYRVLITVKKNEAVLLTVPYNFLVIEP